MIIVFERRIIYIKIFSLAVGLKIFLETNTEISRIHQELVNDYDINYIRDILGIDAWREEAFSDLWKPSIRCVGATFQQINNGQQSIDLFLTWTI